MDITSRLSTCAALPQQKEKLDAFRSVFNDILSSSQSIGTNEIPLLNSYVETILDDQVGLVIGRQLLAEYIDLFETRIVDPVIQKELLRYAIDQTQPRQVSFEELLSNMCEKLAGVYQAESNFTEAARILQMIPLESGHRSVSDDYKLRIYIHIVRLLLEEDEALRAERHLNRAALLLSTSSELSLQLSFKLSQARILDAKRRFLDACSKYHELSSVPQLDEEERVLCLTSAVQCAVMAGAGSRRSRSLATLYKDERTHHLPCFAILEKTYMDRLIRPEEASEFASTLKSHHLARLADNKTTVFDRAMMEHNVLSVSKIYDNIGFDQLGNLLSISSQQAEKVAARMISEGRMVGSIDQVDGIMSFESGGAALDDVGDDEPDALQNVTQGTPLQQQQQQQQQRVEQSMREIMKWDSSIHTLCQKVDDVITQIRAAYPDYAPAAEV